MAEKSPRDLPSVRDSKPLDNPEPPELSRIDDRDNSRRPRGAVMSYTGPLPLPAHIEQYEAVLPGAADRIFAMAEAEQRSRLEIAQSESRVATELASREMALQEEGQRGQIGIERLGMFLGAGMIIVIIAAAFGFAAMAPDRLERVSAFVIALGTAAGALIYGVRRNASPSAPEQTQGKGSGNKSNPGKRPQPRR